MEASTCFACGSFVTAFFLAASLSYVVRDAVRRGRRVVQVQGSLDVQADWLSRLLRNGVPALDKPVAWLCRLGWIDQGLHQASWWLGCKGYETDAPQVGQISLLLGIVMCLVLWPFTGSLVAGLALWAVVCAVVVILSRREQTAHREAVRNAVPDALHAMNACFKAGYSLLQTFQQLSREEVGPLKESFRKAASDLETGQSSEETLDRLRASADIQEIAFVSVALEIQHRSGGSMQQILDTARDSINSELELHRSLQVQTAQARLSAQVVTVMPFALLALISLVSPGFLGPFFQSAAGFLLLTLALVMQATGVLLARRMLKVSDDL